MSRSVVGAAAAVALVVLAVGTVVGCRNPDPGSVRTAPTQRDSRTTPPAPPRPGLQLPTARSSPHYLTRSYRAPAGLVARGAGGTLSVPSLHVSAPVDAVGLDDGAMAIPDDPARVGWLRTTARAGDAVGASVLSGHVSDVHDVPGALSTLEEVRLGADVFWTDSHGTRHRYLVTGLRRYPRATGVPARLFRTDGPHLLYLVTCTDRRQTAGGGFHYASNLVVAARAEAGAR